ncbi:PKD domain-containing protein [Mucilaginibacter sp. AW1-3]
MKLKFISTCSLILGLLATGLYEGCKPETFGDGNGLSAAGLTASFTATPVAGKNNYYVLKANENGVLGIKWDLGDGGGSSISKAIDTVFYPDAGTYNVVLTVIGKGGATATATQPITIATSDPNSGNLVLGGKFTSAADDAKWTHFIVGPGNNMVINTSKSVMTSNQTGYNAGAIAQAITLTAGKKYAVDMIVSGSGMTDSWFEIWIDTKAPVNGQDYNTGKNVLSLNTWSGCGGTAFNGKLSALSCTGTGNPFIPPTTGTYYLVIKNGGSNTGVTGVSFTNVTLRGI